MGIPGRFREPLALAEASAFGVAGVVAALLGPRPWLAAGAGPLIAVVVLVIATWPSRGPDVKPQHDIAELVHQWADELKDDDPARAHAHYAVELADSIKDLTSQCERGIVHIDDDSPQEAASAQEAARKQEAARDRLRKINDYVTMSVDTYTDTRSASVKAAEWSTLVRRLQTARGWLQDELDRLPRRS